LTADRLASPPTGALLRTLSSACALVLAAALLLVAGPPERGGPLAVGAAHARPAEPSREGGRLSLDVLRHEGVVTAETPLRLRVRVRNGGLLDRDDVRLVATVHQATIGRFRLQQALGEGVVGAIVHPFVGDVGEVPARGSRTVDLTQTVEELGLDRSGQEGVYPLRLQLLVDGDVADELVTSVIVAPQRSEVPLAVSLLLPLGLPPAHDAEGVVTDGAILDALAEYGVLSRTLAILEANPSLAATLALDGHTLRDVEELADGFALRSEGAVLVQSADSPAAVRARALLGELTEVTRQRRIEALPLPYASADLVALVRHGLETEAARQITDGAEVVARRLPGSRPSTDALWPADALDGSTLAMARATGVRTVVLEERALAIPPAGNLSPSPVRRLRDGGTVRAVVPDPYLVPLLERGSADGPVLAAQQILAEVATVYFERPGLADRGLLLAPPAGAAVPPDVLEALAGPLAAAPFVRTVGLSALAERVAAEPGIVALDYPAEARQRELPLTYGSMLASARRALGSLDRVLAEASGLTGRFDRLLLQSASTHYREDPAAGRGLLRMVSGTVADVYASVEVLDSPPVTLTAVEGQLPVTVRSTAEVPLRVQVRLASARYEVEGGPTREVVLAPGTTEILTFRVRAVTPGGTSPVQVVVSDLDGVLDLASGTVVVRSTAFSVVAVVVTAGAGAFLLLWWARGRAARRRRSASSTEPRPGPARAPDKIPASRERT
jgi:hypothetical protein